MSQSSGTTRVSVGKGASAEAFRAPPPGKRRGVSWTAVGWKSQGGREDESSEHQRETQRTGYALMFDSKTTQRAVEKEAANGKGLPRPPNSPQRRRRDPRHRREVRRQSGHRHRLDDRADRHEPRRSGFGPQLSLSYDSGAGNGPFGFGWSLGRRRSPARPTRACRSTATPQESDVFILSGAEDLVPVLVEHGRAVGPRDAPDRTIGAEPTASTATARASRGCSPASSAGRSTADGDVHWRSISRDNVLTLVRQGRRTPASPIPADPARIFTLADLRDPRRQGQRRPLRLQAGGRRRRRSDAAPTSATAATATTRAARPTATSSASATATARRCSTTPGSGRAS